MFNFLPPSHRKKMRQEYKLRKIIIATLFVTAIGGLSVIFLVPAYVLTNVKASEVEADVEILDMQISEKGLVDIAAELRDAQGKLKLFSEKERSANVSDLLREVIAVQMNAIEVTSFQYQEGVGDKKDTFTLRVSGVSEDRESLVSFARELRKSDHFSLVDLPVSNLAQDTNLPFNMVIEGPII